MGRRNQDDPNDIDYHFDPDAAKKNTYSAKQKAARQQDVLDLEHKTFLFYVKSYYVAWFVSFVLIIVSLSTTGWFVSYQEQKTFSLAQDVLWRQIDFRMSYEGLKVHIQFCPQMPDGEENPVSGELKCVLETEGYRSFGEIDFWNPLMGRKKSTPYKAYALQAAGASSNLMGLQVFNLLMSFVVVGTITYGVYKKPHRLACLLTFAVLLFTSGLGLMANCLFLVDTQPLRDLLLMDNYINEVEPELHPGFSFYIGMLGTVFLLGTGIPFWLLIPYDNGTLAGGEADEILKSERALRVKQYLDDRTNSSYQDELFTDTPNPKLKAVPMRPPSKLPPLSSGGGFRTMDSAMSQPGNTLSGPGSPGPGSPFARASAGPSTPFGAAPLSPNIRMGSPLSELVASSPGGSPPASPGFSSPASLPGTPLAAATTLAAATPLAHSTSVGSPGIGSTAPELVEKTRPSRALPSPFPVNKINAAPKPPSLPVAVNDDGDEGDTPGSLVTRKRVVTRIPHFRDMAFRRNLPVGCKPDGLLNNYNVEIVEHKLVNGKLTEIRIQK